MFSVPIEDGSTRNVTASDGVREYSALWSPDGDRIAYIVESLEGQSLVLVDQDGGGEKRRIELGPHFYELLGWGRGDPGTIVLRDNHLALFALDVAGGRLRKVSTGARRGAVDIAISPDGRWLAYTEELPNYLSGLKLYEFSSRKSWPVTEGDADVTSPAFGKDGKYLFFAASTNAGPLQVGLNMTSREKPYRAGLYAAVLAGDGESPLLPRSGDENDAAADDDEESDDEQEDEDSDSPPATRVDPEGLAGRVVALPVAERNYGNLAVIEDGSLLYIDYVQDGAENAPPGDDEDAANRLMRFDFEDREASELETDVSAFTVSADGKYLLLVDSDDGLTTAEAGDELDPESVDLSDVRLRIDPGLEWQQIFDEAWRMQKEYFYADNMHGVDWDAVYGRYRPLVAHVGRREDLNTLIVQMIAELQVGHNRAGGGDVYSEDGPGTGLLGANFAVSNGRYQITRVYRGAAWNPFVDAPLNVPGHSVADGEYLIAINGRELDADDNVFEHLEGLAGKRVTLTVSPRANGRDARDVVVEPTNSERELRLWSWVEANRRAVDAASDGRVGYVYLPNTGGAGFAFFNRMFFSQLDKAALIIDERSNGGGQAANYMVDVLSRQHLSGWRDRDGLPFATPAGAMHGPMVMLIDQDAGSGGDFLPYSFRHLGLGPLIGTRTWGGLIGIAHNPDLVDGGDIVVPFFRFFDADGEWSIENEGVAPDIEVSLDPIATNNGRDTQLERAIREVQSMLADYESPVKMTPPPLPSEPGR